MEWNITVLRKTNPEVCSWWHLQSWAEWISHSGAGWRWLLWSWSPSYTNQDRNHYFSHQDTECSWGEGSSDQRVDRSCPEALWLPWRQRRALCRESGHKRSVCHCPGRVSTLQTPWRACGSKGLLWCASVHYGEWGQGLRGCGVWEAPRTEGQVHEVCGWSDDSQWRPC